MSIAFVDGINTTFVYKQGLQQITALSPPLISYN